MHIAPCVANESEVFSLALSQIDTSLHYEATDIVALVHRAVCLLPPQLCLVVIAPITNKNVARLSGRIGIVKMVSHQPTVIHPSRLSRTDPASISYGDRRNVLTKTFSRFPLFELSLI